MWVIPLNTTNRKLKEKCFNCRYFMEDFVETEDYYDERRIWCVYNNEEIEFDEETCENWELSSVTWSTLIKSYLNHYKLEWKEYPFKVDEFKYCSKCITNVLNEEFNKREKEYLKGRV